jgi:hypothetical protein
MLDDGYAIGTASPATVGLGWRIRLVNELTGRIRL